VKILITANSPGEVAWIRPLAEEAQRRGWTIDVILYPCTFATGQEAEVLRGYPAVDKVWEKSELAGLAWRHGHRYPPGTPLLHLGGDLMYTALLQWRWKWRCWSYLWARPWWNGFFAGYFSRNAQSTRGLLRRRVPPQRILEVGDLVVDAVLGQVPQLPQPEPDLITFLPGSRQEEIRHNIPFYAKIAEILLESRPHLRFQAMLSPFLSLEVVAQLLERPVDARLDSTPGRLQGEHFVCQSGFVLPLIRQNGLAHTARSCLAVSLPGTKTAEAACLAVPCLTLVPLNCPELLPYGGLLGLLDWLPGGRRWKGAWLLRQRHKVGLLAQPNQLLGQAIMPEIIDRVSAAGVANRISQFLDQPEALQEKGLRLRQAYLDLAGASARMLDALV
jgi:lipid-A-disaccharide synthase